MIRNELQYDEYEGQWYKNSFVDTPGRSKWVFKVFFHEILICFEKVQKYMYFLFFIFIFFGPIYILNLCTSVVFYALSEKNQK